MQLIEVLILATILYASWRFGQPIVHRKEMIKRMRQGKAPTKKQCILIKSKKLDPKNWLVVLDNKEKLVIRHRESNLVRNIYKEDQQ